VREDFADGVLSHRMFVAAVWVAGDLDVRGKRQTSLLATRSLMTPSRSGRKSCESVASFTQTFRFSSVIGLPFLPLTSRTVRVTSCPVRGIGQRALIAMQASQAPPRIAVFIGLSLNPEWRVLEGCRQSGHNPFWGYYWDGPPLASVCIYRVGSSINFCTRQFSNSAAYKVFSEGQASS
jgi:hypothetical protein